VVTVVTHDFRSVSMLYLELADQKELAILLSTFSRTWSEQTFKFTYMHTIKNCSQWIQYRYKHCTKLSIHRRHTDISRAYL